MPLRVIREPRLGLSYARERGFQEASYGVVSFIDDDNWATMEWVAVVSEVMSNNPDVGTIGRVNRSVAEVQFPAWFATYCEYYASWISTICAGPSHVNRRWHDHSKEDLAGSQAKQTSICN